MFEFVKGRTAENGLKVFVYFNIRKKCFSVKALEGKYAGLVVLHTDNLAVSDVNFFVSEKRRQKVLDKKCKNVHAGAVGHLELNKTLEEEVELVTYNPYLYSTFVFKKDENPVYQTKVAYFVNKQVYISK